MTQQLFTPRLWFNGEVTTGNARTLQTGELGRVGYATLTAAGLLTGEGFFETLAVYRGRPFALADHVARLNRSLRQFGMQPLHAEVVNSAITALLQDPHLLPAVLRLRLTVWRTGACTQDLSALLLPANGPAVGQLNTVPAAVVTAGSRRNEHSILTGHKSTSYAANSFVLRSAQAAGATEAVFYNTAGDLAEGTLSNLLLERNGKLVTPPLSSGCLPGITRALVLRWAAAAGHSIREAAPGELTMERLSTGDFSAALLGTLRNVQHISSWDQQRLPRGAQLTAIAELFATQMPTMLS